MVLSLNCIILGDTTTFPITLGDKITLDDMQYNIDVFRISNLKQYIFSKKKESKLSGISDPDDLVLWKVNVSKDKLKGVYTTEHIMNKLNGENMDEVYFISQYFDVNQHPDTNIHIIVVPPAATAGPSQQGVPQRPNWNDASSIYEWIQQQFTLDRERKQMRLVGTFGQNFELFQRDDTIKTLWNGHQGISGIAKRFQFRTETDKGYHPIPVLAGGPGVGKSRFLDEVEELIKKKAEESQNNAFTNMITINTTYGNSTIADDIDEMIKAHASLGIRILFEYFQPKHKDYTQSYNFVSFRSCCIQDNPDISLFTLDIALQIIYKDFVQINPTTLNPILVLVLGIDEFNKLHVQNQEVCRKLIHAIGATMCGSPEYIYFIPILAGTIEGPLNDYITGSMHEPLPLPLRLLSDDDAIKIGTKMKLFDDEYVSLHPYFRLSISDIGGHVRTLEYYYELFSSQSEIETERIKLEPGEMMSEEEILKTALANAILGFPVQKYDPVTEGSSMTYQELSSMGIVNLVLMEQTEYLIRLPHLWVCAIVESSNDPGMIYWRSMLKYNEPMNWSNFEDFNTKFWALRLSLFRLKGYEKIELKTLFKGADLSLSFPDVNVDLPKIKDIKLYKLLHRYPGIMSCRFFLS